jgi:hypothetical protein
VRDGGWAAQPLEKEHQSARNQAPRPTAWRQQVFELSWPRLCTPSFLAARRLSSRATVVLPSRELPRFRTNPSPAPSLSLPRQQPKHRSRDHADPHHPHRPPPPRARLRRLRLRLQPAGLPLQPPSGVDVNRVHHLHRAGRLPHHHRRDKHQQR